MPKPPHGQRRKGPRKEAPRQSAGAVKDAHSPPRTGRSEAKAPVEPTRSQPRRDITKPGDARPAQWPHKADRRASGENHDDRRKAAKPPSRPAHSRPSRNAKRAIATADVETRRPDEPVRIAKAVARAGLCSRREAERWVLEGRVSVNGVILSSPARDVGPDDRVVVDGRPLPGPEPVQLWRYYKPKGLVTTNRDPEGRPTVFDSLPAHLPRVVSVGRLDFNTEGLLLLTNDGELARHLELPTTGWSRRYRVRAHGKVTQADLDGLKNGVEVDGVRYGPIEALLDREQGANVWLTMSLREGKNREVRNVLGKLGLDVNRLIRVSYGPFQLLDMQPGTVESVRRRVIAEQLGRDLAQRFGLRDEAEEQRAERHRRRGRTSGAKGSASGPDAGPDGDEP